VVASIETDEQFLADLAADYSAQRINRAKFLAAQDPVHAASCRRGDGSTS
jgi:hypothetical protein